MRFFEKLHVINETDAEGNTIERERRTTVNHAMKILPPGLERRGAAQPRQASPHESVGSSDRETPTATSTSCGRSALRRSRWDCGRPRPPR
jgi:hypothetical protein